MSELEPAEVLRLRLAAMAERHAVEEAEQPEPEPLRQPVGFVDLIFDGHCLTDMRDARGNKTEIGNWIEMSGSTRVLRIPWPPGDRLGNPNENTPGKAHRNAGPTERAAANMQRPKSGTTRARVLAAFIADWRAGGFGLIDEDLPDRTNGMNFYTAAPRRNELVHQGWLRASGHYGRTKLDSPSIRWELTPEAIERLGIRKGAT